MSYLLQTATPKKTKQSQPIPSREKDMARNNAGGVAFKADSFVRLERFLILGSEGGTYYVGESDLTKQNVDNVRACIYEDGLRTVKTITDISTAGRAPKNDPALYALALAASFGGDLKVREAALAALPTVARIGTHLFQFCAFIDTMRGWGPALRRAIAQWYLEKPTDKLAYQLVKYQSRNGWSHRDVLRLSHAPSKSVLIRWATCGEVGPRDFKGPKQRVYGPALGELPELIQAVEQAKRADEKGIIGLIRDHGLTREMIPTEHQKSPAVWEALLQKMPMTAMIRTLGRMGAIGLLAPLSNASRQIVAQLGNRELLRKSRVHPIQVLSALLTYGAGHGQKGSLAWTVVPQVVDALNDAFYAAFENTEPTGKRFYLGIDVSGSMAGGVVAGIEGLTPNMGAAAMAMLVARTEPNYFIGGFSHSFVDLGISKSDRLDTAMRKCQRDFGGTDCAVAIRHALSKKYPVDCFVVITDGETWAGNQHTSQALQDYRNKSGVDSKLVVINMVANRTSLADPKDPGSLDVVGFDASVPAIISGFLGSNGQSATEDAE
jgi:60 kDa SS-A/Ro ribonucleoprotein